MTSQNKIYGFEVTPPVGAWEHIAKTLDEWEQHRSLSNKINTIESTPPPQLWNNIAEKLAESDQEQILSQKLYHIAATAPNNIWEQISKELDDQKALEIIERKLNNIQIQPPQSVWVNVKHELDGKKTHRALVVPMHHGWLKYAAAACFIAIVSISSYLVLKDNDGATTQAVANLATNATSASINTTLASSEPTVIQANEDTKEQVMAGIRTKLGNAYTASNEKNNDLNNRYIILMTQDGNIVRISKKVSNMADCIAGEDNSCDAQLSKWQKEMANSAVTAGPNNFLDILDIASKDEPEAATKPNM